MCRQATARASACSMPPAQPLSCRLTEMPQIGRRLTLPGRHQETVSAEEVVLAIDPQLVLVLAANGFEPLRIARAVVAPGHRPRLRQRAVLDCGLVDENVRIGLVEVEPLADNGLAVLVERHAAAVVAARALDGARLDRQEVVTAVAVAVLPLADRVAGRDRLD